LGRARRSRTTMQQVPIGYNGTFQIHPKLPLLLRRSPPPSNTPIPRPTPLTITNGTRIQLAVLPQYTFRTDRQTQTQTNRWARRQVDSISAYARYIDRGRNLETGRVAITRSGEWTRAPRALSVGEQCIAPTAGGCSRRCGWGRGLIS